MGNCILRRGGKNRVSLIDYDKVIHTFTSVEENWYSFTVSKDGYMYYPSRPYRQFNINDVVPPYYSSNEWLLYIPVRKGDRVNIYDAYARQGTIYGFK